jgi:hypothetical protein
MNPEKSNANPFSVPMGLFFILVFGAAVILRIKGLFFDLWLDEIWTLSILKEVRDPLEIATRIHSDNNHILNSLWIFLIGTTDKLYLYRLLSFICSLLTFPVLWHLIRKKPGLEQAIILLFFSLSFPLVLYGSEARGYAPMILFCLLAFYLLEEILNGCTKTKKLFFFWISIIAGVLCHLSMLQGYLAFLIWSIWRMRNKIHIQLLVKVHLIPLTAISLLYFYFIRQLPPGTGTIRSYPEVLIESISVLFGGPMLAACKVEWGAAALVTAVTILTVTALEIVLLLKKKSDRSFFYLLIIFIIPVLTLILLQPRVIFLRYFLINLIFLFFTSASFCSRIWRNGPIGKLLVCLLIALFCAGSGKYLLLFLQHGRGEYKNALSFIVNNSDGNYITVSSDQEYRNRKVIEYYEPEFAGIKFIYFDTAENTEFTPEWFLLHSESPFCPPQKPVFLLSRENEYKPVKIFPHAGLSGWSWYIYRRS